MIVSLFPVNAIWVNSYGFAVLYSTLVLYATKRLGFSESQANAMMGGNPPIFWSTQK